MDSDAFGKEECRNETPPLGFIVEIAGSHSIHGPSKFFSLEVRPPGEKFSSLEVRPPGK